MRPVVSDTKRILGIDPGSRLTGFGVLDFDGDRPAYVASGTIRSPDGDFPERLKKIFVSVKEIVAEYRPEVVAATFAFDVEVFEYAPREIKLAVVGTGSASKEQVQHMVVSLLQLDGPPALDASDALATAICHGHRRRMQAHLSRDNAVGGLR